MADEPDLTASQVARMLGLNRSSVWRMDRGRLPYVETSGGGHRRGRRRYALRDVQALVDAADMPTLAGRVTRLEERVDAIEHRLP